MPESRQSLNLAAHEFLKENPAAPAHNPIRAAIQKATELGANDVVAALHAMASMPPSTGVIANPVLFEQMVTCGRAEIALQIRAFAIRGVLGEWEIVESSLPPEHVIFVGLFGRRPKTSPDEGGELLTLLNDAFWAAIGGRPGELSATRASAVRDVAEFMKRFPNAEPAVVMQHFAVLRKAASKHHATAHGVNARRAPDDLLMEMVKVHSQNVAIGGLAAFAAHVLRSQPAVSADELTRTSIAFLASLSTENVFDVSYGLLLGRVPNAAERDILRRLGTIQIHHGSAGSNMVARYLTTLHAPSVEDLFVAAQLALDSARHFGAIHDMTDFINELEPKSPAEREAAIRQHILEGGLPTFGHPEIAAAGRSNHLEQDPRAAVYLAPLFAALDAGHVSLTSRQKDRLAIAQRIYQLAFVEGVVKPGRDASEVLRLTPNTDYGAWAVQEALGIDELARTLLTYVFRGFGWMMDVREQLQQKIIRPVIVPDPSIVPSRQSATSSVVPTLVRAMHDRLATGSGFGRG